VQPQQISRLLWKLWTQLDLSRSRFHLEFPRLAPLVLEMSLHSHSTRKMATCLRLQWRAMVLTSHKALTSHFRRPSKPMKPKRVQQRTTFAAGVAFVIIRLGIASVSWVSGVLMGPEGRGIVMIAGTENRICQLPSLGQLQLHTDSHKEDRIQNLCFHFHETRNRSSIVVHNINVMFS